MRNSTRWTRPRRAARPRPYARLLPAGPSLAHAAPGMADLAQAVRQWLEVTR
ncbi:hypothetical protein [Nocardiopsis sp. LOL_012]|uniref:hypothetical protein n=1 Tax=Nocardiopsis sp. LOL_012 TaxID=3345409 RepID=UPI003A8487BA